MKVFELLLAPYKELIEFQFNDHMFMVTQPEAICDKLVEEMRLCIEQMTCTEKVFD
jgi:hypothetical protein